MAGKRKRKPATEVVIEVRLQLHVWGNGGSGSWYFQQVDYVFIEKPFTRKAKRP